MRYILLKASSVSQQAQQTCEGDICNSRTVCSAVPGTVCPHIFHTQCKDKVKQNYQPEGFAEQGQGKVRAESVLISSG